MTLRARNMPDTPTPGQICYEAYIATGSYPAREYPPWRDLVPREQQRWEAAAQAVLAMPTTFAEKSALNQWAAARYDALMQEGKHGHYETIRFPRFRELRGSARSGESVRANEHAPFLACLGYKSLDTLSSGTP